MQGAASTAPAGRERPHQCILDEQQHSSAATRLSEAMSPGTHGNPDKTNLGVGVGGHKTKGACAEPASRCPLWTSPTGRASVETFQQSDLPVTSKHGLVCVRSK